MLRTSSKWGKFDFDLKFGLEGHGRLPPKTIGPLTNVFFIFGPNLVIQAWTGDELSRGQTLWRTDGRTEATIPGGQNWPRVKINKNTNYRSPIDDEYCLKIQPLLVSLKKAFGNRADSHTEFRCFILMLIFVGMIFKKKHWNITISLLAYNYLGFIFFVQCNDLSNF